ncbi:MAG: M48 family metalloprotease [Pirellulaceae bacterium]
MQLSLLVALVAAIVVSENAPHEPVDAGRLRLFLALAGGLAVVLLAVVSSRAIARSIEGDQSRRGLGVRAFTRLKQIHMGAWLGVTVATLLTLHWPILVRYNWGFDHFILVKDLLILAPIWMPWMLSWAAFYEVDLAIHRSQTRILASGHSEPSLPFTSRGGYVWMHARHYLGLGILPVLVLLVFQDVMSLMAPQWEESRGAWIVYVVPLAALAVAFPYILSRIWRTAPLPPSALRDRLAELTRRMGVQCREFRIWHTDRQILNAAVAGVLPSMRTIFMTDALVVHLRDDELEAVIAHELGHILRHHLPLRMLLLGLPLWLIGSFQTLAPELTERATAWQAALAGDPSPTWYLLLASLALAGTVMALGWYSRLLEHDADLCVYEAGQAETFITTIDRLSYLCHERRGRAAWLHPSTVARIHLLQRVLHHPEMAGAFRRRVERVNRALVLLWILVPLVAWLL